MKEKINYILQKYEFINPDIDFGNILLKEIENKSIYDDYENTLNLSLVLKIVREFLNTISSNLTKSFNKMLNSEKIITGDNTCYDVHSNIIYINLCNSIVDIYGLVHEFFHSKEDKNIEVLSMLIDIPTYTIELLLSDFLKENYPNLSNDVDSYNKRRNYNDALAYAEYIELNKIFNSVKSNNSIDKRDINITVRKNILKLIDDIDEEGTLDMFGILPNIYVEYYYILGHMCASIYSETLYEEVKDNKKLLLDINKQLSEYEIKDNSVKQKVY